MTKFLHPPYCTPDFSWVPPCHFSRLVRYYFEGKEGGKHVLYFLRYFTKLYTPHNNGLTLVVGRRAEVVLWQFKIAHFGCTCKVLHQGRRQQFDIGLANPFLFPSLPFLSLTPIHFFLSLFVVVGPSFFSSTLHPSPSLHFRLPPFRSRHLKSS